jgi:HEAT repeat protein
LPLVEGDPKAIPVLTELFHSPDPKARRIAIEGVRCIGEKARVAMPLLLEALEDADSNVSDEAFDVLFHWDKALLLDWLEDRKRRRADQAKELQGSSTPDD